MTEPAPDDPDRIPTQAELDAEDLAEMSRVSREQDNLYPSVPGDPGDPPRELAVTARLMVIGAVLAGLVCLVYGVVNFGAVSDALSARMSSDATAAPAGQPSDSQIDTFATALPVAGLVIMALFMLGEYLLVVATARHHSRGARSFFLTLVVLNLMCIPVGLDLFFDYPELWSAIIVCGWVQFALLILAAITSLRRSVSQWLPEPTRLRPTRTSRGR